MNIKHVQRPGKLVFMDEEEIKAALKRMVKDVSLTTNPGLSKDESGESHVVSFYQEHLTYLKKHPKVNPENYLSNLRAMLRVRT